MVWRKAKNGNKCNCCSSSSSSSSSSSDSSSYSGSTSDSRSTSRSHSDSRSTSVSSSKSYSSSGPITGKCCGLNPAYIVDSVTSSSPETIETWLDEIRPKDTGYYFHGPVYNDQTGEYYAAVLCLGQEGTNQYGEPECDCEEMSTGLGYICIDDMEEGSCLNAQSVVPGTAEWTEGESCFSAEPGSDVANYDGCDNFLDPCKLGCPQCSKCEDCFFPSRDNESGSRIIFSEPGLDSNASLWLFNVRGEYGTDRLPQVGPGGECDSAGPNRIPIEYNPDFDWTGKKWNVTTARQERWAYEDDKYGPNQDFQANYYLLQYKFYICDFEEGEFQDGNPPLKDVTDEVVLNPEALTSVTVFCNGAVPDDPNYECDDDCRDVDYFPGDIPDSITDGVGDQVPEVMYCPDEDPDDGRILKSRNAKEKKVKAKNIERRSLPAGPGTELKKLLKVFGLPDRPGCKCNKRAKVMDSWGPDKCSEPDRMTEIIGWLKEEATKQKVPFVEWAARVIVKRAIRNSRKVK